MGISFRRTINFSLSQLCWVSTVYAHLLKKMSHKLNKIRYEERQRKTKWSEVMKTANTVATKQKNGCYVNYVIRANGTNEWWHIAHTNIHTEICNAMILKSTFETNQWTITKWIEMIWCIFKSWQNNWETNTPTGGGVGRERTFGILNIAYI